MPSCEPSFRRNASDTSKFGERTDKEVSGASDLYGDMLVGDAEREAIMEVALGLDERP